MKNLKKASVILLSLCLILGIVACSSEPSAEESIAGRYTAGTHWNQMSYEFDGNEKVTLHASSMSYEYFTLERTYDINEEENQITLTFPTNTLSGMDMASYAGTFSFSMGEDYLMIGNVRYETEKPFGQPTRLAIML